MNDLFATKILAIENFWKFYLEPASAHNNNNNNNNNEKLY